MRLVRFMGAEEMEKYIAGLALVNRTNWMIDQYKATHSKGFCFFDDSVAPEKRMEYLTGIVDMTICAVFRPINTDKLRVSYRRYRDPDKDGKVMSLSEVLTRPIAYQSVKEYSLEQYSKRTMQLDKIGLCVPCEHRIVWGTRKVVNQ